MRPLVSLPSCLAFLRFGSLLTRRPFRQSSAEAPVRWRAAVVLQLRARRGPGRVLLLRVVPEATRAGQGAPHPVPGWAEEAAQARDTQGTHRTRLMRRLARFSDCNTFDAGYVMSSSIVFGIETDSILGVFRASATHLATICCAPFDLAARWAPGPYLTLYIMIPHGIYGTCVLTALSLNDYGRLVYTNNLHFLCICDIIAMSFSRVFCCII